MSTVGILLATATSQINSGLTSACTTACNNSATLEGVFAAIANTLTYLVGAISVIMIIIGALRYVTSNGDAKQASAAKDTILYAVIGVVVAIMAYAIIFFVTSRVGA